MTDNEDVFKEAEIVLNEAFCDILRECFEREEERRRQKRRAKWSWVIKVFFHEQHHSE